MGGWRRRFPGLAVFTEEAVDEISSDGPSAVAAAAAAAAASELLGKIHLDHDIVFPIDDLLLIVDPLDATKE